jgi:hypothetical protein
MKNLGDHVVICDVCGKKFRKSQTRIINDKYNTLNKMVVCFKDYEQTNPQAIPHVLKERILYDIKKVRPPGTDIYVSDGTSDRLPSAPRNLTATLNILTNQIDLTWQGPDDTGSDRIIGYFVTRAEPQYSFQFTVTENTGSDTPFYTDVSGDIDASYTYAVAAITSLGMGPFSNLAPYPVQEVQVGINYLAVSQTSIVLATGDGTSIILSVG